jgi:hypothetical protein
LAAFDGLQEVGGSVTHRLYDLLATLDTGRWHYTLHRTQPDHVTILVTLVGQRIEIYVSANGDVGYSVFAGDESVQQDFSALLDMLKPNA